MSVQTDGMAGPLPRGRHRLSRAEVESSQYQRLCAAALVVVGELGYAATTVADIVARAQVARRTFYAMFGGKDDCFAAAYDFGIELGLRRVGETIGAWETSDFAARIRLSFEVHLAMLAADPAATRALYVEALAAGGPLTAHRARVHDLFADCLMGIVRAGVGTGDLPTAPDPGLVDMLIGGIDDRIRACLTERGAAALPELAPLFTHTTLVLCRAGAVAR
ncbi:TetR/AcrR family transcriptional regulator [Nocardia sp. CDC159]|uniref:TetR/AcrR family transcriptional regulator n=1 Tax=Nocardia pulmonis TaxID=2951408 RepID=A0A9X2J1K1_9NOCA|nr:MULTISPECIES: TetR/AcrR family transcriptional regulator [Nocardia]MCM6777101.1 TetR/AcrR family transcriptional regulator [Nocardia pulmonis]MCM6789986.1 TetR/AcrR family transcriptional regulator [Nocardia sp. CDC159]